MTETATIKSYNIQISLNHGEKDCIMKRGKKKWKRR